MSRNAYRTMSPAEVSAINAKTWLNMAIMGVPVEFLIDSRTGKPIQRQYLTYELAVQRAGLRLVEADITYSLDAEGKPVLDEKGKPIVESINKPAHDWGCNVKVEGFADSYGTAIPKGTQYFVNEKQPHNRQLTFSNVQDLQKRLSHWMLNGETLIKDESGSGQNEQHRCDAVILDKLMGLNLAPAEGIPVITIDGIATEAAGSIDTGKQKTAKDDLTSNHELLAPSLPLTQQDFMEGTSLGFGEYQKQKRQSILGEMQGICKRIALRMGGANIKASKFTGYESAGNVMIIAERWGGLDELVNLVDVFVKAIPAKVDKKQQRPVKTWEVATAYALYCLRDCETLPSVDSLSEYEFPEIDLTPIKQFCTDLMQGAVMGDGPLADWAKDRVTTARLNDKDESSFAQVMRALQLHCLGEEVSSDINKAAITGSQKENSKTFFHFGGGDRGPIVKEKKVKESDNE